MFVVMGATGHVGSAAADRLLEEGEAVTVVLRDPAKARAWQERGAAVAIADVRDVEALRAAFGRGRRAFLLNPPAPPAGDTDRLEHETAAAIVEALHGSGLERVVAQSAYGAQPGERIGDLSVLYDFEQALARQPIPVTVQRGAYFMSNWDALLPAAREGTLPTFHPADLAVPSVAPADLGASAARLLRRTEPTAGIHHVEGPTRPTARDVAAAFAAALGHPVEVETIPRERWLDHYRALGFSPEAADAYARMTATSVDGGFAMPADPDRGETTIGRYVRQLVERG